MFPARAVARLPLQLTPEQRDEYTAVAHCVRDDTLAMYEAHLARPPNAPAFDDHEWKLLKRKQHIKIFVSRRKHHTTAYPLTTPALAVSEIHRSAVWEPQSKLLCIGNEPGTIEDGMYGGCNPTEKAMMIRSMTIQDDFVDHKTLCDIRVPTEETPFTYTGLKWSARPPYLATMVRPRDMTYVEATGFCTVNIKGRQERAGFFVFHSVENIPGMPDLSEYGFMRCRFSLCSITRPNGNGTNDVFAVIASDAGGDLPRNLTTLFSAKSLMAIYKTMDNGLKKKLVWLRAARSHAILRGSDAMATFARPRRDSFMGTSVAVCPQCSRELFVLQPLTLCHVCEARVCSRCMTTQKLVLGQTKEELAQVSMPTCKGCLLAASKMDARKLAIFEFVRPFDAGCSESLPTTRSVSTNFSREYSFFGTRESATSTYSFSRTERTSHTSRTERTSHTSDTSYTSYTSHSSHSSEWVPVPGSVSMERDQLWEQIYNLRLQAELTYQATKQQSLSMQEDDLYHL
jgi:hypothetical protein